MSCIIRGGIIFLALAALWNASCVVDAWTTVPAATAFSGAFSSGNVKDSATIDHVRSLSAFATANAGGKSSRGRNNGALYSTRAALSSDQLLTIKFQHETLFIDHENNVGFRIMELNDIEATLDAVVESFAKGEPLSHSFGMTVLTIMLVRSYALDSFKGLETPTRARGTFVNARWHLRAAPTAVATNRLGQENMAICKQLLRLSYLIENLLVPSSMLIPAVVLYASPF